ncbi:hypothetical protein N0V93_000785 [Gnomoniopsis smithogilvyi]|uniref:Btz domain-containing protein n=1 Tax=Gnomoniopsis smithogilvyi TaxID=1191159 RepID=A0A9W8Z2V0_9PEZI|nr:hypothetical protein N0V93_000785 [Gnomoniopsis smithogilvyi]
MAGAPPKRTNRRTLGHRRRVDDDGDDEAGPETLDHLDDDSVTEGSVISEDNDHANDSDTSNVDEASPTSPVLKKTSGRGTAKHGGHRGTVVAKELDGQVTQDVADAEAQLNGLTISDEVNTVKEGDAAFVPVKSTGPVVVSSTSIQSQEAPFERRRREHEEYRKKRDEDPAFVPNRGAFFMHDHRHAGPAANGFRPFGRGAMRGGRGGGRGAFGGPFAPVNNQFQPKFLDPTISAPWAHDMHEVVAQPMPVRPPRQSIQPPEGLPNGDGHIPTCPPSDTPINRTLSTEKALGNVEIRVFFPGLKEPKSFSGIPMKRYTKLPDHRPPLRRDKPVRISLPDNPPRYIFPAVDRSFIFIPRAMRPNQQRVRGKSRAGFGSVGGYSRRTSVYGGSYYGSVYTPSLGGMSRRSSIAPGDFISPTGSAMSRPIVRLPPLVQPQMPMQMHGPPPVFLPPPPPPVEIAAFDTPGPEQQSEAHQEQSETNQASITDLPQPQTHPLPQKPMFQETRPGSAIPMHQPRPQKTVSLQNIESPTQQENTTQQYQQAFHQQMPPQVASSLSQDAHSRNQPYPSQVSTGTPLSQIPERAIHAAPFQPSVYSQPPPQPGYYNQSYQMMPPQPSYYYPPQYSNNMTPSAAAPPFYPGAQQNQGMNYNQSSQGQAPPPQTTDQGGGPSTLVAQDVNGTVYFYDAAQIPTYPTYPAYNTPGYAPNMAMGMSPAPEGYYYNQAPPGMPPY